MIGRIIAAHHASPYLHAANAYAHDPFLAFVGPGWRTGTTPYGPLFALHAAGVAIIAGSHPLLYRIGFQGSAALAVGAALLILWRETRSTAALALVGLHPVITCAVVNGGHNDALVGLGLLVAAVNARRGNYATAGWSLAAAVLVKATAGLAFLPLLGWAWSRGRWRAVGRIAVAPVCVAAPVMLLTPGLMRSLRQAKTIVITRMSIWNVPFRLVPGLLPQRPHAAAVLLVSLALELVVAVAAYGFLAARRAGDPAAGIVVATAAWLIFGAYVLPWYTAWALPTAALAGARSRLAWVVAIQGAATIAVFRVVLPSWQSSPANQLIHIGIPSALAALFVWALFAPTSNSSSAEVTSA